jgi:aspartyl-tRNA(Asn)/glutamyl-tRNA(Gln) amidotransferase subunit B
MEQMALGLKEADALTQDAATGDLLDGAVAAGAPAKRCCNLLLGPAARQANERACAIGQLGLTAAQLARTARMAEEGKINASAAEKVLLALLGGEGDDPEAIAEKLGLLAVTDTSQLEAWVDQALAENPQAVEEVRSGGKKQKKAFGFLMGQVMQASRGAAPPAEVNRLFREKLGL